MQQAADIDINNLELIKAVETKPELYDVSLRRSSNPQYIKELWKEVCSKVLGKRWYSANDVQKYKAYSEIQKRWKNLKNCFKREIRLQKNDNSKSDHQRRKYMYYDAMLFLLNPSGSSEFDHTQDSMDGQGEVQDEMQNEEELAIDNHILIEEIQQLPVIYSKHENTKCSMGKFAKNQAWEKVCAVVFKDWGSWEEHQKEKALLVLKRRWKNLRNCFLRELRLQTLKKSIPRKPYVYYDRLMFLMDHCQTKGNIKLECEDDGDEFDDTQQDFDDEGFEYEEYYEPESKPMIELPKPGNSDENDADFDDGDDDSFTEEQKPTNSNHIPKKRQRDSLVEVILEDPLEIKRNKHFSLDADVNFALSVVPLLKALSPSNKLQAQIEILKILQNFSKTDN